MNTTFQFPSTIQQVMGMRNKKKNALKSLISQLFKKDKYFFDRLQNAARE
jgi:hypothetical protein